MSVRTHYRNTLRSRLVVPGVATLLWLSPSARAWIGATRDPGWTGQPVASSESPAQVTSTTIVGRWKAKAGVEATLILKADGTGSLKGSEGNEEFTYSIQGNKLVMVQGAEVITYTFTLSRDTLSLRGNGVKEASFARDRSTRAIGQNRKLYPVDEASKDPSFKAFRDELLDAARRHDSKFILNSLDPGVQNDFGGGYGVKDFEQKWNLTERPVSELWEILVTILSMGGSFQVSEGKRLFCAPYVYSRWPDGLDEDVDYVAIVGDRVAVREQPSSAAQIVTYLSYDIVKADGEDSAPEGAHRGWTKIAVPAGGAGYVASKYLRGPGDYRACFAKVRGRWVMTALIAGD